MSKSIVKPHWCRYYGHGICNDGTVAEATGCRGDRGQCDHRERLRRAEPQQGRKEGGK